MLVCAMSIMATSASIGFLGATLEPHLRQFDLGPILLGECSAKAQHFGGFLIYDFPSSVPLRRCVHHKWRLLCSDSANLGMDGR